MKPWADPAGLYVGPAPTVAEPFPEPSLAFFCHFQIRNFVVSDAEAAAHRQLARAELLELFPPTDFGNALYWAPRLPAPLIPAFPLSNDLRNATLRYWQALGVPPPLPPVRPLVNASHPFFFPCLARVDAPQPLAGNTFVALRAGPVPAALFPPTVGEYSLAFFLTADSENVGEIIALGSSWRLSLGGGRVALRWRDAEREGEELEAVSENVWRKEDARKWIQVAVRKWEQRVDVFLDGRAVLLQSAIPKTFGEKIVFGPARALVAHASYYNHIISDAQLATHAALVSEKRLPPALRLYLAVSANDLREEAAPWDASLSAFTAGVGCFVAGAVFFFLSFQKQQQQRGAAVPQGECAACAERRRLEEAEEETAEEAEKQKKGGEPRSEEEAEERRARKQRKKAEARRRREEQSAAEREQRRRQEEEKKGLEAERGELRGRLQEAEQERRAARERAAELQGRLARLLAERCVVVWAVFSCFHLFFCLVDSPWFLFSSRFLFDSLFLLLSLSFRFALSSLLAVFSIALSSPPHLLCPPPGAGRSGTRRSGGRTARSCAGRRRRRARPSSVSWPAWSWCCATGGSAPAWQRCTRSFRQRLAGTDPRTPPTGTARSSRRCSCIIPTSRQVFCLLWRLC